MRKKFNEAKYYELTLIGEIEAKVKRNKHPNWIAAWVPYCTYSQEVSYIREGQEVARVHQYFRPDGRLGASGKPDPKRLMVDNVLYRLSKKEAQLEQEPDWRHRLRAAYWWVVNRVLASGLIRLP